MTLRDKILKSLAGSSSAKSVELDQLRKVATAAGCEDLTELYNLLDDMCIKHEVMRSSGMRNHMPCLAYWLTKPVAVELPTPAVQPRVHRLEPAAKVQPKTADPQPNTSTPQEPTMEEIKGLSTVMVEIVTAQPGIKLEALHAAVEAKVPGTTLKQVNNNAYQIKAIKRVGRGMDAAFHPADSAPPQATATAAAAKGPVCTGPALDISFHMDGSLIIGRGEQAIALEPKEALQLMQFCSHQLPFADRASA